MFKRNGAIGASATFLTPLDAPAPRNLLPNAYCVFLSPFFFPLHSYCSETTGSVTQVEPWTQWGHSEAQPGVQRQIEGLSLSVTSTPRPLIPHIWTPPHLEHRTNNPFPHGPSSDLLVSLDSAVGPVAAAVSPPRLSRSFSNCYPRASAFFDLRPPVLMHHLPMNANPFSRLSTLARLRINPSS